MSKLRSKEPLMFREINLIRDSTFEVFKGRKRSKSSRRGQVEVENAKSFLARDP
jgi:hypothetical protein